MNVKFIQINKCRDCPFAEHTIEAEGFCHFYKRFFTSSEGEKSRKKWEKTPVFCEIKSLKITMEKRS
jgi:hypothetical protein